MPERAAGHAGWGRVRVIFSGGDTIQFARVSVPTAGGCLAGWLGGVLPVFVIPFLISYFAVTVKWFNFADFFRRGEGFFFLGRSLAIFACRACYVSMYLFFIFLWVCVPLSIKSEMRIVRKFVAYAENICYIAWQSKRRVIDRRNGIFFEWYLAAGNAVAWNMSKSVYL